MASTTSNTVITLPSSSVSRDKKLIDYTQRGKGISQYHSCKAQSRCNVASNSSPFGQQSSDEIKSSAGSCAQSVPSLQEFAYLRTSQGVLKDDPIDFFLKIPSKENRKMTSDLRERFRKSRTISPKQGSLIQTVLTPRAAPRKLL